MGRTRLEELHEFLGGIVRQPEGLPEGLVLEARRLMGRCRHEETEIGYGFGFGPLGTYKVCSLCGKHLAHSPDPDGISPEQYAAAVKLCEENGLPPVHFDAPAKTQGGKP